MNGLYEMSSWYELLKEKMEEDGEDFHDRECTLDEAGLKKEFYVGFGLVEGQPFTAWGEYWVYFPLVHDGWESVGHAPRNPWGMAMEHQP